MKKFIKIDKIYQKIILNILSIAGIIVCYVLNNNVNMLNHKYGSLLLFLVGAYSGIIIVLELSELISKTNMINRVFTFLGKNSLLIMIFSEPIKRIVIKIFSSIIKMDVNILRANVLYSIICTAITITISIPIIYVIKRFFPFMIGKKRNASI